MAEAQATYRDALDDDQVEESLWRRLLTKVTGGGRGRKRSWKDRLKNWFWGARGIGFIVLLALCVVRPLDPLPVESLRLKTFDWYQRLLPRVPPANVPRQVVVLDIDEESLAAVGQWPWPRTFLAQMVQNLMAMGAAVVGFDVFFVEPDRMSPAAFAQSVEGLDEELKQKLEAMPSNDQVFADVLKQSRVVLGQTAYQEEITRATELPKTTPLAFIGGDPKPYLWLYQAAVGNTPVLAKAASGRGMVTIKPDSDSVVRRVPAILLVKDNIYPTLAFEMLRVALGQSTYAIRLGRDGIQNVVVPKFKKIPTDRHGQMYVYYRQHHVSKADGMYISAKDVLFGTVDPKTIQGRLVLVGTSAAGLLDIRNSPVDDNIPGVEVHANMLENILHGQLLQRPGDALGMELVTALVAGLVMIVLVPLFGAAWTAGLAVVMIAGAFGVSWYMFSENLTLIDATYPAATAFILYTLLTYTNYAKTAAERKQVRGAFAQYLSPALVEQLADDPDRLALGGEMKDMTLLFADIRGFTTISEQFKSDPEGLTRLINRFLTPMTDIILERQGTIDKYMGDCIMAFWNAPLDDANHARHAAQSALAMFTRLDDLNVEIKAEREEAGEMFFPLNIGIGLNSGECCVGNMGSVQRFDYSVLGDAVNLAARLEGQSKNYGVGIVIGEETQKAIEGFASLELDLIAVKGKIEAVRIFGLVGDEEFAQSDGFKALASKHEQMLVVYREQKWQEAKDLVAEGRALQNDIDLSVVYDLYDERADHYLEVPPPADWDGVFVATSK